jgi:hypothetical protein
MQTHRASLFSDSLITCWVRDEDGKRDLSAFTLTATIYPYGKAPEILTLSATSAEDGKVEFTITAEDATASLCPGLYRFVITGADGGDSETLYSGLLEAV